MEVYGGCSVPERCFMKHKLVRIHDKLLFVNQFMPILALFGQTQWEQTKIQQLQLNRFV